MTSGGEAQTRVLGAGPAWALARARVLCVGAGGIGCELLKNLALMGIGEVHVVDLDTIDVSNLNRQFLFRKEHVGKPKSTVAAEAARAMNPGIKVVAYHANVKLPEYGADFMRQFDVVLSALDNLDARRHINHVCLSCNVPLIESGTAGYLGQVQVIRKGRTECFECHPKPTPKTFPVCTIRSSPSTPIHCIVWGKMLFQRLFGKQDDSNAVSDVGASRDADGRSVFHKVFHTDIVDLAAMEDLWKMRKAPVPLAIDAVLGDETGGAPAKAGGLKDQRVWSVGENAQQFLDAYARLRARGAAEPEMEFDKDDDDILSFVTATANLRAHLFGIALQSRFDVKAYAGNIIPAIATTNAIIAGLIVVEAVKIIGEQHDAARSTFVQRRPTRNKLFQSMVPPGPNSKCTVCSSQSMMLAIDTTTATLGTLVNDVLRGQLGFLAPMVMITSANNFIFEYDEDDDAMDTLLAQRFTDIPVGNNTSIRVEDFLQDLRLDLTVQHVAVDGFRLEGEAPKVGAGSVGDGDDGDDGQDADGDVLMGDAAGDQDDDDDDDDDDDIQVVLENVPKRKDPSGGGPARKRTKAADADAEVVVDLD